MGKSPTVADTSAHSPIFDRATIGKIRKKFKSFDSSVIIFRNFQKEGQNQEKLMLPISLKLTSNLTNACILWSSLGLFIGRNDHNSQSS